MSHKYLYVFEHHTKVIVEAKRLDVMEGTPKSDICFWLLLDRVEGTCEKLDFVSMKKGEPLQERIFKQGTLSFDADTAMFNDGYYLTLFSQISKDDIPENVKDIVTNFLEKQY